METKFPPYNIPSSEKMHNPKDYEIKWWVLMVSSFAWFVWSLIVTISNVVFSIVVFYFLSSQKKLSRHLNVLKYMSLYYAVGMMASVILASVLLLS